MKILVAIKPVPNPDEKVKIRPDGSGINLDNIKMVINPFCEIAVEEALRIKEKQGGEVAILTVGPKEGEQQMRTALAMGADRAILVETSMGLDSLAVAKYMAKAIEQEKPDLVLMGKQAVDDDNNQVGQILAALLNWPQATFASKVEFLEGNKKARVGRETDGGIETIEVPLPCVVTTDLRLNEPRYASLPGIMKAKKKELKVIPGASLGVDASPRVRVLFLAPPRERAGGRKVADVAELVALLSNEAKVL
ncbi:MAG: electron transfer flavoprotein subunit beta [Deltaproteobacteria bacterium RBG_19FT_COMBO_60_16]|nr:MAG: electron transfer flavoprotein subunit beta [Deltaproteobacteria bacterium RBG_16_64_85]OGQ00559.1 MAG: electron transfer flavoprotein subunit beta [Deltaproteobacteria bacterium RBG_19FT_COMBO_60_16]